MMMIYHNYHPMLPAYITCTSLQNMDPRSIATSSIIQLLVSGLYSLHNLCKLLFSKTQT